MDDDILDRIRELEAERDDAIETRDGLEIELENKKKQRDSYKKLRSSILDAKKELQKASSKGDSAVNNLNANYKGKVAKKRSVNYLNSFSIIRDVNRNLDTCLTEAIFKKRKLDEEIEELETEIRRMSRLIDSYNDELNSLY